MSDLRSPILVRYLRPCKSAIPLLILGLRRVDLVDIAQNPARQIADALEALGLQEEPGLFAPHPRLALHDEVRVLVEFDEPLLEIAKRNQDRPRNAIDLIFLRFADVDDDQVLAAIEFSLQLARRQRIGVA